jgi:hypothetical protein
VDVSASVLESVSGQECFGARVCERIPRVFLIEGWQCRQDHSRRGLRFPDGWSEDRLHDRVYWLFVRLAGLAEESASVFEGVSPLRGCK